MNSRNSQRNEAPAKPSSLRSPRGSGPEIDQSSPQKSMIGPLGRITPANASHYQRLLGNQLVLRLMRQSVEGTVQRDEESARLLNELATPKIQPGPEVEAQKELVNALDADDDFAGGMINLGGFLFDHALMEDKSDINDQAQFMTFPKTGGFISAGYSRSEFLKKKGLDNLLKQNILSTMIHAQQIKYLRLAGLPNDDWKILVEVHYYRERDMSQTGLHKDTLGETLFVNLNYHMDRQVVGPEFVVNPEPSQQHDELTQKTLPKEFRDDLQYTREQLGAPTEYDTSIVNPYGYVAFVDEAIHHATPYYDHRYVTGKNLQDYLAEKHSEKLQEANKAKNSSNSRWNIFGKSFSQYVNTEIIPKDEVSKWEELVQLAEDFEKKITRNDLNGAMTDDEFNQVLDWTGSKGGDRTKGGTAGFYSAQIPKSGPNSPIKNKSAEPLKRRLSDPDFRKQLPERPKENEKRTFFRTWVRVIPTGKAETLKKAQV